MFKKFFKTEPQTFKKIIKISLFASFLTSAVTEPFWVLQSKMAVKSKNTGFLDVFIKMMKNDGFMCFFKGLAASLFLSINPIIQFSVYELLKRKMSIFMRKYEISCFLLELKKGEVIRYFLLAGFSKLIATIFTYPYQVIRTNMHVIILFFLLNSSKITIFSKNLN